MSGPRRHGRGRVALLVAVAVLIVAGAGGAAAFLYGRDQLGPPSATHGTPVAIKVTPNESVDQVADDLSAKGMIKSRFWFTLYAGYKGLAGRLHAGMFLVDNGMGASAIVAKLEGRPDIATVTVVFAEGMTARQMAATAAATQGLHITAADYYTLATHPSGFRGSFLSDLPAGAPLEGFLFPDTYFVPTNASARDLIQMQLDAFAAKALPALSAGASSSLTPYQAVTVASIIEREAKFAADRPLVSGVIANRLAAGMKLQVDATVLYGVGVTGRSPTAAELALDTPYNSYLHAGLPPTPIANPGVPSIQAALNPARTQYLFYVSDCDGHNHYSVTGAEHEQQVSTYLASPCPG